MTVCTTGLAVSCTGAAGKVSAGAATASLSTTSVVGAEAAGTRWITICTGGAATVTGTCVTGGTGANGTVDVTDSSAPMTGLSSPSTVTMPSIVVAPSPAARMRLPWAT